MSKFYLCCVSGLAGLALLPPAQAATDCSAVTQIPPTECEVLLDFYNSTSGANWTDNTGWNQNNTPCDWKGVTCGDGHITSLDLGGNQLSGSIPDSLGNLSNLQSLHLGFNELIGSIPDSIGNLSNLQNLDLYSNQLSGSIPDSLSNLSHLQYLRLNFNQLSGTIPNSLGNLSNLQWLYLRDNQLSGTIPDWLGNFSNLQVLDLDYNQLSGTIPDSLSQLSNLQDLDLGSNQLSGTIPDSLSQLSNLQKLDLGSNQLSGTIPDSLSQLSNLQKLDLDYNQLSGSIPDSLGNLSNLQWLYLSDNQLSGTIPDSLGNLSNLQWLYLRDNQLSGSIPDSLGHLSNLQRLNLDDNQLSGTIPDSLGHLNHLQYLSLHGNQLSGSIPNSLGNLSNLQGLYLDNNQLSGSIPDSLGNLGNLETLLLDNNELCRDIPLSLMNLKKLSWLGLNDNHLTASDPDLISWLNQFNFGWYVWAWNQTPCPQAQTCLVYALHQDSLNNTQFTTIAPNLNFQINPLGNPHSGYNIKNIDILSATNEIYAASGSNPEIGHDQGYLYRINRDNGELIPVCGTGLGEITALSFHPTDNKLWVWSNGEGLFVIDINSIDNGTCHPTEVLRHPATITDLTWDNAGQILYGLMGTTLYKYFSDTGAVETACDHFPAEVTALDTLADGSLLLAGHNSNESHISSFDPNTCSLVAQAPLATNNYGGIEGITWMCYFE
jgi:Leucine-rich repeat (LRR) protein